MGDALWSFFEGFCMGYTISSFFYWLFMKYVIRPSL